MWKEMSFLIAHHAQHITGFLKTELMISIDIYVSVNPNQILKTVLSIWNALFVVPMLAYLCPKTSLLPEEKSKGMFTGACFGLGSSYIIRVW